MIGSDKSEAGREVLVVIPCYNEEKTIESVVRSIYALGEDYQPLVVDDGSGDASYAVASRLAPCLQLPHNLGIGGAVQAGIKYAARHGYRYCAQIDGDGQHIATELLPLAAKVRAGEADLALGSRYLEKRGFQSTFFRRLGGAIISKTLGITFGVKITDPTSGLRVMNRRCIDIFNNNYPYDYPEPVSLAIALSSSLKVAEAPAVMKEREFGVSSIIGPKKIAYMVRVISFIIIARIKKS